MKIEKAFEIMMKAFRDEMLPFKPKKTIFVQTEIYVGAFQQQIVVRNDELTNEPFVYTVDPFDFFTPQELAFYIGHLAGSYFATQPVPPINDNIVLSDN